MFAPVRRWRVDDVEPATCGVAGEAAWGARDCAGSAPVAASSASFAATPARDVQAVFLNYSAGGSPLFDAAGVRVAPPSPLPIPACTPGRELAFASDAAPSHAAASSSRRVGSLNGPAQPCRMSRAALAGSDDGLSPFERSRKRLMDGSRAFWRAVEDSRSGGGSAAMEDDEALTRPPPPRLACEWPVFGPFANAAPCSACSGSEPTAACEHCGTPVCEGDARVCGGSAGAPGYCGLVFCHGCSLSARAAATGAATPPRAAFFAPRSSAAAAPTLAAARAGLAAPPLPPRCYKCDTRAKAAAGKGGPVVLSQSSAMLS